MPPIHVMIKPVSGACNLRCVYCFYADEAAHRERASYGVMQPDTVRALVRRAFLYADDALTFSFQGGEPTLAGVGFYRDFVKTVESYNTRGAAVSYSLQTNGTLLDDEFCAFLAANRFLVGVSLDGTAEIHDALRKDGEGNGSFARALRGLELLRAHGVECNILCVLTQDAAKNIRTVFRALSPYGHIQFIPCIDGLDGERTPFSLDAKTYGDALVEIFDLYSAAFFSHAPVRERRMENYLSILLGYPPEACGMCGGCGLYFLCEADGSVFPCDFYATDAWKLGNIKETSFARMAKSETMRRFLTEGATLPENCRACNYFALCRGGCRRDREPDLAANRFCESYRAFFDRRLDRMTALCARIEAQR